MGRDRAQPSPHEASGFFVLRTPIWPLDELDRAARDGGLGAWVEERMALPGVREAIYLASPSFLDQWDERARRTDDERTRLGLAALRYLQRMASRPTPFGLFAACTLGRIAERTHLELAPVEETRRHTRLDHDYLDRLAAAFHASPEARATLRVRPNSSLYTAGDRLRLVEASHRGAVRDYTLVSLDPDEALALVLEAARDGATRDQLRDRLCEIDPELSPGDVEAYLDSLVDAQVLVAECAPELTGDDTQASWSRALGSHPGLRRGADTLATLLGDLAELDARREPEAARYGDLLRASAELPLAAEPGRFVQVDATRPALHATLGRDALAAIQRGIRVLRAFAPRQEGGELSRFREAFVDRFELQEVPLMEALDPEVGIGFPPARPGDGESSPWLRGLALGGTSAAPQPTWESRETILLRKLAEALSARAKVLTLEPADWHPLESVERPPLPDSFSVLACLFEAQDESAGVFLRSVCGPSGARLVGRFAGLDRELLECVRAHLVAEEAGAPDAVHAEVVHLPEGRAGNVVARPVLRSWEIPYLGASGLPLERQIAPDDLRVSVRGSRIVLRSARLGREVIPRLATAHDFTHRTLPLYRLLSALQTQGVEGWLSWTWGPLEIAPFLPRVVAEGVVLARAAWKIRRLDLVELERHAGHERREAVRRWRAQRELPPRVVFQEMDNELYVDLEDDSSVAAFLDAGLAAASIILLEHFPSAAESPVRSVDGRYAHEIVIPFHRAPASAPLEPRSSGPVVVRAERFAERVYPPGSEWLYAQVFCGEAAADRLLGEVVEPWIARLRADGVARRWFFVRYDESGWQLRVRVHGPADRLASHALPLLREGLEPHLASGLARRFRLETYDREVERYGGAAALIQCEAIFEADSDLGLAWLPHWRAEAGAERRGPALLLSIDRLLDDLGLDSAARLELLAQWRDGFAREFGAPKPLRVRLGERFRQRRRPIEELLDGRNVEAEALEPALRERSRHIRAAVDVIRRLERAGELGVRWSDLAGSLAHMAVNRLARSSPRAHELVVYDTLVRVEEGRAARRRANRPASLAGAPNS